MSSFEQMMLQLRREYLAELPKKMADIEAKMKEGLDLRDDYHKLKGTGATYGIPEISQLGECMEQICLHHKSMATTHAPAALELLNLIHQARIQDRTFPLEQDVRFTAMRQLLNFNQI